MGNKSQCRSKGFGYRRAGKDYENVDPENPQKFIKKLVAKPD